MGEVNQTRWLVLAGLPLAIAAGTAACIKRVPTPAQSLAGESTAPASDLTWLVDALRAGGAVIQSQDEVEQPFFSVSGTLIAVDGEDVQVFVYPSVASAVTDAALVAVNGQSVGTFKPQWIGSPHFFKKEKLIVLYVGDDGKVLDALRAALGQAFAGK